MSVFAPVNLLTEEKEVGIFNGPIKMEVMYFGMSVLKFATRTGNSELHKEQDKRLIEILQGCSSLRNVAVGYDIDASAFPVIGADAIC